MKKLIIGLIVGALLGASLLLGVQYVKAIRTDVNNITAFLNKSIQAQQRQTIAPAVEREGK